ncbi:MFS transporter [Tenuibacillus multivorans]|uniref:Predicted arabinose efflux permease, MFS family n=1 Tax=Tenuibacillus multivorans TaxID=237069 RepID=A0A1H0G0D2_9BACI|nr:MFS transporter [Tenuibacillus multivorans]GEL78135.1 putative MFS-type transporter YfkF [Tenuibacillus multivorans]SDO00312.1 Predicted arabinose efflux permease, MFS family [Tenuibacillus multivorans]
MVNERTRFAILVTIVGISGFSQGMLLPLIAVLLEQNGISSSVNGIHATALYIGILLISPFLEKPLRTFGYKPMILVGGALVFTSLFFFTIWESLWFWFILRMMIGIGDNILHFGTQTWITTTTPDERRGRNIAIYGLMFAVGFATGPVMTRLIEIDPALPFIISAFLCLIVWSLMFFVRNEFPIQEEEMQVTSTKSIGRFIGSIKYAWVAFLAPFAYGFLEASLHGNFPVYAMRLGHDVSIISIIIPCFAAASIISQIPLGILSDKIGRKKVLAFVLIGGIMTFFIATFVEESVVWLLIIFSVAGLLVGSLFSLGMSYMTDLLPKSLLPAGNIICGAAFSLGSISGPAISGMFIDYFPGYSFFYVITFFLAIILILILSKREISKS